MARPKTYACWRFPEYSIGGSIRFKDGLFTAQTDEEQRLVESNDWFGTFIKEVRQDEQPQRAVAPTQARRGLRGSKDY